MTHRYGKLMTETTVFVSLSHPMAPSTVKLHLYYELLMIPSDLVVSAKSVNKDSSRTLYFVQFNLAEVKSSD